MSKKYRVILSILVGTAIVGVIISLPLPSLVKQNIRSGDLTLPTVYEGYHYGLTKLIIFIMTASILSITFIERQIITVILSVFVLILVWLVRHSIHFQGFIDHDYDSKTGTGFLVLFIAVITHFVISSSAFLIQLKKQKANITKSE